MQSLFPIAGRLIPWLAAGALTFCGGGLVVALLVGPADPHQGELYRILYVQMPAAWTSMLICVVMAGCAAAGLTDPAPTGRLLSAALAPTGAMFCFIALWTGLLWGKPSFGAWWVWDIRLTSQVVLMLFFLAYMALGTRGPFSGMKQRLGAVLLVLGVVGVLLNYLSVVSWSTLHHGVAVSLAGGASLSAAVLSGMLSMTIGFVLYSAAMGLARTRCMILEHERETDWAAQYARGLQ